MQASYVLLLLFALGFLVYWGHTAIFGATCTPRFDKLAVGPWLPRLFLEYGYCLYRAPIRLCVALGIGADTLTAASIALAALGAVTIGRGQFTIGGWILLAAFTCDGMDGVLARATGSVSRRGEFLDSVADHYADPIGYLGFAYYYRERLPILLVVALAMLGSSLVSYTRAKGAALGVDTNIGVMRRFERAVWMGGGTVVAPIAAALLEPGAVRPIYHVVVGVMALLAVLTHYTVYLRARAVLRALGSS
jgi:phosphatidylglycerophosphate synthase